MGHAGGAAANGASTRGVAAQPKDTTAGAIQTERTNELFTGELQSMTHEARGL